MRGGTQTYGRLFRRREPVIRALREAIRETVEAFVAALSDEADHPFLGCKTGTIRFSGSWSVRLRDQGFHSSAYYVALPATVADPATRDGRLHFGVPPVPVPEEVAPVKEIQPRVGTLALFPSYCWHGTVPFAAGSPRMTVAFDVARSRRG